MKKNNDDAFFKALKEKTEEKLPQNFDENFWNKFDQKNLQQTKSPFLRWIKILGLPLTAIALALFVALQSPREFHGVNEAVEIEQDLSGLSPEDLEVALNLEFLESIDIEDELLPQSEEEWDKLIDGESKNGG